MNRNLYLSCYSSQDWVKLVDLGMAPLHLEYDMNPQDKIPVTVIGPQVTANIARIANAVQCHS